MFCPNCGTENADTNRFCLKCGTALETKSVQSVTPQPSRVYTPPTPRSPAASAAITGGFAGIIGGAMAVIGWVMPWFRIGTGLGSLFRISISTGSGLQLLIAVLAAVLGSFDGKSTSSAAGIQLIALLLVLVLITIPLLGILNVRAGIKVFEKRLSVSKQDVSDIGSSINGLRARSTTGFILMVVIYVLVSLIPFLTPFLGSGFFVTAGAFALTFLGVLFAKSQIRTS